jgi:hypothetical protein
MHNVTPTPSNSTTQQRFDDAVDRLYNHVINRTASIMSLENDLGKVAALTQCGQTVTPDQIQKLKAVIRHIVDGNHFTHDPTVPKFPSTFGVPELNNYSPRPGATE